MLRISRLTDYGTVVLAHLADPETILAIAAEVAASTGIALPTVSKLLKELARAELVKSTRGSHGGYTLARRATDISAAEIIDALEGPVSITECSGSDRHCNFESVCSVGGAWKRINIAIRETLINISLADLLPCNHAALRFQFAGMPIAVETKN